jgi:hypothetical protein
MPSDLPLTPALRRVEPPVRYTYAVVYVLAAAEDPVGHLLDRAGQPLSMRKLARFAGYASHKTAADHVRKLITTALLRRDGMQLFVPALMGTSGSAPAVRTATAPTPAVDNQLSLLPDDAGLPPPGWVVDHPQVGSGSPTHTYRGLETEKYVRPVDLEEPVENLEGPGLIAEWVDAVPDAIGDPDVRYLLGKLAWSSEAWRAALQRQGREIVWLCQRYPSQIRQLLEQESLEPTARKPVRWLTATSKLLAPAGVAS